MYPAIPQLNQSLDRMFRYISPESYTILDYHDIPYSREEYALHLRHDMHPTPRLHARMAESLVNALNADHHQAMDPS